MIQTQDEKEPAHVPHPKDQMVEPTDTIDTTDEARQKPSGTVMPQSKEETVDLRAQTEMKQPRWRDFQGQAHSLRISASEIAALTGFHPYRSLPKTFMDQVYQGRAGQELLLHDAKLLGISFVSEDEMLLDLAKKAGSSTLAVLKSALQVKSGEKKVQTVETAESIKKRVLDEAKKSQKLTQAELKQLQQGTSHSVNTGFGNTWEDRALDMYERQCGWEVRDRNVEIRTWPFGKADINGIPSVAPLQHAYGRPTFHSLVFEENTKRQKTEAGSTVVDVIAEGEPSSVVDTISRSADTFAAGDKSSTEPPFFSMRGAVDGIRDELAFNNECSRSSGPHGSPSEEDSWILHRVIVECKHRMNRIQPSPPLYEQIQTTAYCLMYEVEDADIIQVLRKRKTKPKKAKDVAGGSSKSANLNASPSKEGNLLTNYFPDINKGTEKEESTTTANNNNKAGVTKESEVVGEFTQEDSANSVKEDNGNAGPTKNGASAKDGSDGESKHRELSKEADSKEMQHLQDEAALEIAVSRVTLDDPLLQHRQNWNGVILPRLRSWTEAVYTVRQSDDKRYRLLQTMREPSQLADAWRIIFDECPWLEECDTGYNRDVDVL
jgi:hypothetical protein